MTTPTATAPQVHIHIGYGATDPGYHAPPRLERAHLYQPCPFVIVVPAVGPPNWRWTDAFRSLAVPPNQPNTHMVIREAEVGAAYNVAVDMLLHHNAFSAAPWKWMITLEQDNLVGPFGVVDLLNEAEGGSWDVLGGLYHTKGPGGVPQIWGDRERPLNFVPQPARPGEVVATWGTGMGFTAFRLDVFRSMPGPWFDTTSSETEGSFTQDLKFFQRAHTSGLDLKVGVDCRIRVGHLDVANDTIW